MNIIKSDILANLPNNKVCVILHGCNCFHVMGGGIAAYLKNKFPYIYKVDKKTNYGDITKLGTISIAELNNNLLIINCYTQYNYDASQRQVNYEAVYNCLVNVQTLIKNNEQLVDLRAPKIGCGLAGGNWKIINEMFDELLPYATIYEI